MPRAIAKLITALLVVFATFSPVLAKPTGVLESLRHRLEKLEALENEAEDFTLRAGDRRLTIFGALQVEGAYNKTAEQPAESDFSVATALLGFDASHSDQHKARIVLLYEEDDEPTVEVDVAKLTVTRPDTLGGTLTIQAGLDHLPFGAFTSVMVTDPLTLDLGEIRKTGLATSWENGKMIFQVAAFNGERVSSDNNVIDNGVVALTLTPAEQVKFGVSYLCDLAESDFALLGKATADYDKKVSAASAKLTLKVDPVTVNLEYLGALKEFSEEMMADPDKTPELSGRKPRAWFAELSFAPSPEWSLTGRYEKAKDFQDDVARYGANFSYGLDPKTTLSLEYLYSDFARDSMDTASKITVQLSMEF